MAILLPAERRDAVRHEIAYAIVGVAAGHSDVWRSKAIQLGSPGASSHSPNLLLYPWYGLCPDSHLFVSVRPPGLTGFVCEEGAHDEPVDVIKWKRNAETWAHGPGAKKMSETFPEPVPSAAFWYRGDGLRHPVRGREVGQRAVDGESGFGPSVRYSPR